MWERRERREGKSGIGADKKRFCSTGAGRSETHDKLECTKSLIYPSPDEPSEQKIRSPA